MEYPLLLALDCSLGGVYSSSNSLTRKQVRTRQNLIRNELTEPELFTCFMCSCLTPDMAGECLLHQAREHLINSVH